MKPDYSKLDPELQEKIKTWQANSPQHKTLQTLEDIADIFQDFLNAFDDSSKSSKSDIENLGTLLVDIREQLQTLNNKEDPESPDHSTPIVKAVEKMEAAVSKAIKAIEVSPVVTVPEIKIPDIKIPEARVSVDNSSIAKTIATLSQSFKDAIKSIPKPEPVDNSDVVEAIHGLSMITEEVRDRPIPIPQFPGGMTVTNPDGSIIGDTTATGAATEIAQDAQTAVLQQIESNTELLAQLAVVVKNLQQATVDPPYLDKSVNAIRNQVQSGTVTTVTTVTNVADLNNINTYQGKLLMVGQDISAWANVVRGRIT